MPKVIVKREDVIMVGADWREYPGGHKAIVTTVTIDHGNWQEIIMPTYPRFAEAVTAND